MKNLISKEEKDQIDLICKQYKIENYSINPDASIDVDGYVRIVNVDLVEFPIKFNKVSGDFYCSDNKLTSLSGSPRIVYGNFYCRDNNLTSLVGGPHTVGGDLYCRYNKLTSLNGSPTEVGGSLYCSNNHLTSLEGLPVTIGDGLYCSNNNLTSLDGSPSEVSGDFYCTGNELTSLEGSPQTILGSYNCSHNQLTTLEGSPSEVGKGFYYDNNKNLNSTYAGDYDIEVNGVIKCHSNNLPQLFNDNIRHIKLILKYQRPFMIWNDDLTFNEENFTDLILEIEDGLL